MAPINLYWSYKISEDQITWFLPNICVFFFVFYLLLFFCIVISKLRYYGKIHEEEEQMFSVECMPKQIKDAVLLLSEKKHGYIKNYHIFQAANKASGLISITFSVIGFVSLAFKAPSNLGMDRWLGYAICFVSVISVVLVLYLTPVNRVFQYNAAWKLCERRMNCAKASTCYYGALKNSYDAAVESNKAKEIEIATHNIMRVAVTITNTINDAENLLTSDGD